jgi:hypothetical protein
MRCAWSRIWWWNIIRADFRRGSKRFQIPCRAAGDLSFWRAAALTRRSLIAAGALSMPRAPCRAFVLVSGMAAGRRPRAETGSSDPVRLLDRLAADRSRLIGFHLPYPGLMMVERKNGAYRLRSGCLRRAVGQNHVI